ncbi:hypothetical protein KKA47_05105, partial [bacterium]|nr:hypothetical protein [bacterium]
LSPACHPKKKYDGGQVFQITMEVAMGFEVQTLLSGLNDQTHLLHLPNNEIAGDVNVNTPMDTYVPTVEVAGSKSPSAQVTAENKDISLSFDDDELTQVLGAAMVAGFLGSPFKAAGRVANNLLGVYYLWRADSLIEGEKFEGALEASRSAERYFSKAENRYKELEARVKNIRAYSESLSGWDSLSLNEAIARLKLLDAEIAVLEPQDSADKGPLGLRAESTLLLVDMLKEVERGEEAQEYYGKFMNNKKRFAAMDKEIEARDLWESFERVGEHIPARHDVDPARLTNIRNLIRESHKLFAELELHKDAARVSELKGDINRRLMKFDEAAVSYQSSIDNARAVGDQKLEARLTKKLADMTKDSMQKAALYMRVIELDPEYSDPDVDRDRAVNVAQRNFDDAVNSGRIRGGEAFRSLVENSLERFVVAGDHFGQSKVYLQLAESVTEGDPKYLDFLKAALETVRLAQQKTDLNTQAGREQLIAMIEHELNVFNKFHYEDGDAGTEYARGRDSILPLIGSVMRGGFLRRYKDALSAENLAYGTLKNAPFPNELVGEQKKDFPLLIDAAVKQYEELELGKDQARVLLFAAEQYSDDPIKTYDYAAKAADAAGKASANELQYKALKLMEKTSVKMLDYNRAIDALIGLVDSVPARAGSEFEYSFRGMSALDRADMRMVYVGHRMMDGNYENALEQAYKALKIYIETGYLKGQVNALASIGKIRGVLARRSPEEKRKPLVEGTARASDAAIARAKMWREMSPQSSDAASAESAARHAKSDALSDIANQTPGEVKASLRAYSVKEALQLEAHARKIWIAGSSGIAVSHITVTEVTKIPDQLTIEMGERKFEDAIKEFEKLGMYDEAVRIRKYVAEKLTSFGGTGNVIFQYMRILELRGEHGAQIDRADILEKMADIQAGSAPRIRRLDSGHSFNYADSHYRMALDHIEKDSVAYWRIMKKIKKNEVARIRAEMELDFAELKKAKDYNMDTAGKIFDALFRIQEEFDPALTKISTGREARKIAREARKTIGEAGFQYREGNHKEAMRLALRGYALCTKIGEVDGMNKARSLAMRMFPHPEIPSVFSTLDTKPSAEIFDPTQVAPLDGWLQTFSKELGSERFAESIRAIPGFEDITNEGIKGLLDGTNTEGRTKLAVALRTTNIPGLELDRVDWLGTGKAANDAHVFAKARDFLDILIDGASSDPVDQVELVARFKEIPGMDGLQFSDLVDVMDGRRPDLRDVIVSAMIEGQVSGLDMKDVIILGEKGPTMVIDRMESYFAALAADPNESAKSLKATGAFDHLTEGELAAGLSGEDSIVEVLIKEALTDG